MQVIYAWLNWQGYMVFIDTVRPKETSNVNRGTYLASSTKNSVYMHRDQFQNLFGFCPKPGEVHRLEITSLRDSYDEPGNAADAGGLRGTDPGTPQERPQPGGGPRHTPKRHDDSYPAAGAERDQPGRERERQVRAATADSVMPRMTVTFDGVPWNEFVKWSLTLAGYDVIYDGGK